MIRHWLAACAATLLLASAGTVAAQDYPTRPLRFIVPFAAGSATDTLARALGQRMSATLKQPVTVENMPGASGQIAAQAAQRAAPDGYTVLIATNTTHAANQSLFKKLNYDPIGGFEPVTRLGDIALALAVHPRVPAANVQELLAYARSNPGKLTFGSGSSSSRIASELIRMLARIDMVHVPYKSNPQAVTDLLGGQIDMLFADVSTTLPQIQAGAVKGLAVSSARRSPLAPDLPTMQEAGLPGYELTAWFAAFVPAGTPAPVVETLNAAFRAALADPDAQSALLKAGIEPTASTPAELKSFAAAETKKWAEIVKAAGIEPE
jgi:tripartite-type tricarboxylate transporter receptor subunit TctC